MNKSSKGKAVFLGMQIGLTMTCSLCNFQLQPNPYSQIQTFQAQHVCPAWCGQPEEPPTREYQTAPFAAGTSAAVSTASVYTGIINGGTLV